MGFQYHTMAVGNKVQYFNRIARSFRSEGRSVDLPASFRSAYRPGVCLNRTLRKSAITRVFSELYQKLRRIHGCKKRDRDHECRSASLKSKARATLRVRDCLAFPVLQQKDADFVIGEQSVRLKILVFPEAGARCAA